MSTSLSKQELFKRLKENNFTSDETSVDFKVLINSTNLDWQFTSVRNVTFKERI